MPVPHIHKPGSRNHVIWWDQNGEHCSVKDCEINDKPEEETAEVQERQEKEFNRLKKLKMGL